MKLAALYTLFNGLDLASASLRFHKKNFDEVIICYQRISNKGNKNEALDFFLSDISGNGYHIVEFAPDLALSTKENERRKFQLLLDIAKDLSCSHYLLLACDHFYQEQEFTFARDIVERENFVTSFTKMITYYKRPTWRLDPPEDYLCPFISKLLPETKVINQREYPAFVDPSLKVSPFLRARIFGEEEILLHHFSMIRTDIAEKFRNAAASVRWSAQQIDTFLEEYKNAAPGSELSYFGGRKIIEVENIFGL